ncbi:hypothetical protein [Micromonospora arida]
MADTSDAMVRGLNKAISDRETDLRVRGLAPSEDKLLQDLRAHRATYAEDRIPTESPAGSLLDSLVRALAPAPTSHPDLGPDLFGTRQAPPPPSFLAPVEQTQLGADQVQTFLNRLDLTRPAPPTSAELMPGTVPSDAAALWSFTPPGSYVPVSANNFVFEQPAPVDVPRVMHTVWLGSPLSGTSGQVQFRDNVERFATEMAGQQITTVLWTDLSRADFAGPSPEVAKMLAWARSSGVVVLSVDEVFHDREPMVLGDHYRAELGRQISAGYGAASDILRLEVLHRFGGVYTDGDNVPPDPTVLTDTVLQVARQNGYGVGYDAGTRTNAVIVSVRKSRFIETYQELIRERYSLVERELVPTGRIGNRADNVQWVTSEVLRLQRDPVIHRTGPGVLAKLADRLAPASMTLITKFAIGREHSCVADRSRPLQPRYTEAEPTDVLTRVVTELGRGLVDREGDLHLTAVAPIVAGLPDPDAAWRAVVTFILDRPDVFGDVRTVTDRLIVNEKDDETVKLPADVRAALGLDTLDPGDRWIRGEHLHPAAPTRVVEVGAHRVVVRTTSNNQRQQFVLVPDAEWATIANRPLLPEGNNPALIAHGSENNTITVPIRNNDGATGEAQLTPAETSTLMNLLAPDTPTWILAACATGAIDGGFAQQTANATGHGVLAPTGPISIANSPGEPLSTHDDTSWQLFIPDATAQAGWDVINDHAPFEGITATSNNTEHGLEMALVRVERSSRPRADFVDSRNRTRNIRDLMYGHLTSRGMVHGLVLVVDDDSDDRFWKEANSQPYFALIAPDKSRVLIPPPWETGNEVFVVSVHGNETHVDLPMEDGIKSPVTGSQLAHILRAERSFSLAYQRNVKTIVLESCSAGNQVAPDLWKELSRDFDDVIVYSVTAEVRLRRTNDGSRKFPTLQLDPGGHWTVHSHSMPSSYRKMAIAELAIAANYDNWSYPTTGRQDTPIPLEDRARTRSLVREATSAALATTESPKDTFRFNEVVRLAQRHTEPEIVVKAVLTNLLSHLEVRDRIRYLSEMQVREGELVPPASAASWADEYFQRIGPFVHRGGRALAPVRITPQTVLESAPDLVRTWSPSRMEPDEFHGQTLWVPKNTSDVMLHLWARSLAYLLLGGTVFEVVISGRSGKLLGGGAATHAQTAGDQLSDLVGKNLVAQYPDNRARADTLTTHFRNMIRTSRDKVPADLGEGNESGAAIRVDLPVSEQWHLVDKSDVEDTVKAGLPKTAGRALRPPWWSPVILVSVPDTYWSLAQAVVLAAPQSTILPLIDREHHTTLELIHKHLASGDFSDARGLANEIVRNIGNRAARIYNHHGRRLARLVALKRKANHVIAAEATYATMGDTAILLRSVSHWGGTTNDRDYGDYRDIVLPFLVDILGLKIRVFSPTLTDGHLFKRPDADANAPEVPVHYQNGKFSARIYATQPPRPGPPRKTSQGPSPRGQPPGGPTPSGSGRPWIDSGHYPSHPERNNPQQFGGSGPGWAGAPTGPSTLIPSRFANDLEAQREYPSLTQVNPDRSDTNCVLIAITMNMNLDPAETMQWQAPGEDTMPEQHLVVHQRDQLDRLETEPPLYRTDPESVRLAMQQAPDGARGILLARARTRTSHAFNVTTRKLANNTEVDFLDGQRAGLAWAPDNTDEWVFLPMTPNIPPPENSTLIDPTTLDITPEQHPTSTVMPSRSGPTGRSNSDGMRLALPRLEVPATSARQDARAAELLSELHARAERPRVEHSTDGILGPDLFGLLTPAPRPDFMAAGFSYGELNTDQLHHFFDFLDMTAPNGPLGQPVTPGYFQPVPGSIWTDDRTAIPESDVPARKDWVPRPDGLPEDLRQLPDVLEVPLMVHAIWLGSPLGGTPGTADFRRNLAGFANLTRKMAFRTNLFTDITRAEFLRADALPDFRDLEETERDRLDAVQDMLHWARRHKIRLISIHELFHADMDLPIMRFLLAELNKQHGRGYAAASDIIRVLLLVHFGGWYTDGDNSLRKHVVNVNGEPRYAWANELQSRFEEKGYGVHVLSEAKGVNNSSLFAARGHPFFRLYLDQMRQNYEKTQEELISVGGKTDRGTAELLFVREPAFRPRRFSVISRTGPNNLWRLATSIGTVLPALREVTMGGAGSWMSRRPFDASRSFQTEEVPDVLARVAATLIRGLHNRNGDLHLTDVAAVVNGLPDPDSAWEAVVEFILRTPQLATMIRSVTDRTLLPPEQEGGPTGTEILKLPPAVQHRLGLTEPEPGKDPEGAWRLAELARPVHIAAPATVVDGPIGLGTGLGTGLGGGPFAAAELPGLTEEVRQSTSGVRDPQLCLVQADAVRSRLFPAGVRLRRAVTDVDPTSLLDTTFTAANGWPRVPGLAPVTQAMRKAGVGSAAFVVLERPDGIGHAWVLVHTTDGRIIAIDVGAEAEPDRVSALPANPDHFREQRVGPLESAVSMRVQVVDPAGVVIDDAFDPMVESQSTAHAMVDRTPDPRYGAPRRARARATVPPQSSTGPGGPSAATTRYPAPVREAANSALSHLQLRPEVRATLEQKFLQFLSRISNEDNGVSLERLGVLLRGAVTASYYYLDDRHLDVIAGFSPDLVDKLAESPAILPLAVRAPDAIQALFAEFPNTLDSLLSRAFQDTFTYAHDPDLLRFLLAGDRALLKRFEENKSIRESKFTAEDMQILRNMNGDLDLILSEVLPDHLIKILLHSDLGPALADHPGPERWSAFDELATSYTLVEAISQLIRLTEPDTRPAWARQAEPWSRQKYQSLLDNPTIFELSRRYPTAVRAIVAVPKMLEAVVRDEAIARILDQGHLAELLAENPGFGTKLLDLGLIGAAAENPAVSMLLTRNIAHFNSAAEQDLARLLKEAAEPAAPPNRNGDNNVARALRAHPGLSALVGAAAEQRNFDLLNFLKESPATANFLADHPGLLDHPHEYRWLFLSVQNWIFSGLTTTEMRAVLPSIIRGSDWTPDILYAAPNKSSRIVQLIAAEPARREAVTRSGALRAMITQQVSRLAATFLEKPHLLDLVRRDESITAITNFYYPSIFFLLADNPEFMDLLTKNDGSLLRTISKNRSLRRYLSSSTEIPFDRIASHSIVVQRLASDPHSRYPVAGWESLIGNPALLAHLEARPQLLSLLANNPSLTGHLARRHLPDTEEEFAELFDDAVRESIERRNTNTEEWFKPVVDAINGRDASLTAEGIEVTGKSHYLRVLRDSDDVAAALCAQQIALSENLVGEHQKGRITSLLRLRRKVLGDEQTRSLLATRDSLSFALLKTPELLDLLLARPKLREMAEGTPESAAWLYHAPGFFLAMRDDYSLFAEFHDDASMRWMFTSPTQARVLSENPAWLFVRNHHEDVHAGMAGTDTGEQLLKGSPSVAAAIITHGWRAWEGALSKKGFIEALARQPEPVRAAALSTFPLMQVLAAKPSMLESLAAAPVVAERLRSNPYPLTADDYTSVLSEPLRTRLAEHPDQVSKVFSTIEVLRTAMVAPKLVPAMASAPDLLDVLSRSPKLRELLMAQPDVVDDLGNPDGQWLSLLRGWPTLVDFLREDSGHTSLLRENPELLSALSRYRGTLTALQDERLRHLLGKNPELAAVIDRNGIKQLRRREKLFDGLAGDTIPALDRRAWSAVLRDTRLLALLEASPDFARDFFTDPAMVRLYLDRPADFTDAVDRLEREGRQVSATSLETKVNEMADLAAAVTSGPPRAAADPGLPREPASAPQQSEKEQAEQAARSRPADTTVDALRDRFERDEDSRELLTAVIGNPALREAFATSPELPWLLLQRPDLIEKAGDDRDQLDYRFRSYLDSAGKPHVERDFESAFYGWLNDTGIQLHSESPDLRRAARITWEQARFDLADTHRKVAEAVQKRFLVMEPNNPATWELDDEIRFARGIDPRRLSPAEMEVLRRARTGQGIREGDYGINRPAHTHGAWKGQGEVKGFSLTWVLRPDGKVALTVYGVSLKRSGNHYMWEGAGSRYISGPLTIEAVASDPDYVLSQDLIQHRARLASEPAATRNPGERPFDPEAQSRARLIARPAEEAGTTGVGASPAAPSSSSKRKKKKGKTKRAEDEAAAALSPRWSTAAGATFVAPAVGYAQDGRPLPPALAAGPSRPAAMPSESQAP